MDDLLYLAFIWAGVFMASYVANKTRLTSVLYYLALGSLLVNIGVIPETAPEFIKGFSELGLILIMFALGFEEKADNFIKNIGRCWGIALFGAIGPFCAAYVCTWFFWQDQKIALLCGLAMTSTAVSLTMVSLKSEAMHHSKVAKMIMASSVLDAIGSLVLVAVLIPVITHTTEVSLISISLLVLKAIGFFLLVAILGMWVFPIERFGIKRFIAFSEGEKATLVIMLFALSTSLIAHYFGFHPAIGAFLAGLVLREEYFHLADTPKVNLFEHTKRIVDDVAFSWIGPVFFVVLGSQLLFNQTLFFTLLPYVAILTLSIMSIQILFAGLAAQYTAGFKWHESVMVGLGMLGRAELAFVLMDIGYRQYGILSEAAFYTLMGTAFILNIAVPITIKLWKPFYQRANAKLTTES